jgi:hypothetical protein
MGEESWIAEHWSDLAAIVLVAGFIGLVASALRSSLLLGERAPRGGSRRSSAGPRRQSETIARIAVLERRLATLERQVATLSSPASAASGDPFASPLATRPRDLADRIMELAGEGRTPAEIAEIIEEPIGRVELVLNLRRASPRA